MCYTGIKINLISGLLKTTIVQGIICIHVHEDTFIPNPHCNYILVTIFLAFEN